MTTAVTSPAAQEYLEAVHAELADLPADERSELLEDLEQHLSAVEAEGDERSLTTRLGSAADYAAELRAAAGLPPRQTGSARGRALRLRDRLGQVRQQPAVDEVLTFLPTLAPGWWVLRGYLVVLLPCLARISGSRDFPVPAPFGSRALGVAAVLVAVTVSVALGRRRLPRPVALLVLALDLALAITAVGVVRDAPHRLASRRLVVVSTPDPAFRFSPLATVHGPVTDIHPYAADGSPLTGVLLYDQDGRPLQTGRQLWWPDHCRRVLSPPLALDGVPVPFSYPQTYVLDRAGVSLDGSPVQPGQCKPVTPVVIHPPALVRPPAVAPRPATARPAAARPAAARPATARPATARPATHS